MGGATIGHALASAGHSVLFLERGGNPQWDSTVYPPWASDDEAERKAHGIWPERLSRWVDGEMQQLHVPLGCAVGGSTLFYAAALERLDPRDFGDESASRPAWPIAYAEMLPFYEQAEALYKVKQPAPPPPRETPVQAAWQPLTKMPPLSAWDEGLMTHLSSRGLQPERLHVAMAYDDACHECLGVICDRRCKADARHVCIEPALALGHVQLATGCEVTKLVADADSVQKVEARYQGQVHAFRGRIVVLAAGAYFTPALLLRSTNELWPQGLANRSGMVGRNLMFHVSDMLALWAPKRLSRGTACKKALMMRDFYVHDGERLGSFQSMGFDVGPGVIEQHLAMRLEPWLRLDGLWGKRLLRGVARVASLVLGRAGLFATVTEDFPNANNRIVLNDAEPSGIQFEYRVPEELERRALRFRALLKQWLSPWRMVPLNVTPQLNFGHPSGTCRFGDDPQRSVLDRNNKAHGVDNLYVVDASFMPTSGAANPSLTVAANALRVARVVSKHLKTAPYIPLNKPT